jgi:hypothetical protein
LEVNADRLNGDDPVSELEAAGSQFVTSFLFQSSAVVMSSMNV